MAETICSVSLRMLLFLPLSIEATILGTVSPAIKPKTAKLTNNSDNVKPSLCWLLV